LNIQLCESETFGFLVAKIKISKKHRKALKINHEYFAKKIVFALNEKRRKNKWNGIIKRLTICMKVWINFLLLNKKRHN
jgi:hypothetical protein